MPFQSRNLCLKNIDLLAVSTGQVMPDIFSGCIKMEDNLFFPSFIFFENLILPSLIGIIEFSYLIHEHMDILFGRRRLVIMNHEKARITER